MILIWALVIAFACLAIPTVISFVIGRWGEFPQDPFEGIIRVSCDNCEGYGFLLMDGSVVPRSLRKQGYYGPATEWTHTLSAITKECPVCHGAGDYLTERS